MAGNYIGSLQNPADIYSHDLINEAMKYIQDVQSGKMQNVTADHANWLRDFALGQLSRAQGTDTPYDDSWVRQYMGGNTLTSQQRDLGYASQRAGITGNWDSSWAPEAPSAQMAQTLPQQKYALDYARAIGRYDPTAVNEQALSQMIGAGTSPQARELQMQYAIDQLTRTGKFDPSIVSSGPTGGVPTGDQFLQDLLWQSIQDEIAKQSYDPVTQTYKRDANFLQRIAEMIQAWQGRAGEQFAPSRARGFTPASVADIGATAVDRFVASNKESGPQGPPGRESLSHRGANRALTIAQAQRYASAYPDAEAFIRDVNSNSQLTPDMKRELQQWANANRFKPIWRRS